MRRYVNKWSRFTKLWLKDLIKKNRSITSEMKHVKRRNHKNLFQQKTYFPITELHPKQPNQEPVKTLNQILLMNESSQHSERTSRISDFNYSSIQLFYPAI